MSLSKELRTYEFDNIIVDVDRYYSEEEVDAKLLEWAEKVEKLEDDSKMLRSLHAAGVDSWEGYEAARDRFYSE